MTLMVLFSSGVFFDPIFSESKMERKQVYNGNLFIKHSLTLPVKKCFKYEDKFG